LVGLSLFVFFVAAAPAETRCAGLQGDALQRCLQGESRRGGPPVVFFFDAQEKSVAIDKTVVNRSMTEVCRTIGKDGVFTAYRSGGDLRQGKKWKEVECRGGRMDGLWREYIQSDETLTILLYDADNRVVKQKFYLNGRLIREITVAPR
jgi:hypothetical protein